MTTETAFAKKKHELDSSTCSNELLELLPSVSPVDKCVFQKLKLLSVVTQSPEGAHSHLCELFDAFDFRLCLFKSLDGFGRG